MKDSIKRYKIKIAELNEDDAYDREESFKFKGILSIAEQQVLSRLFEKAGESYLKATELSKEDRFSKAIQLYDKAVNYAKYPDVKKRIRKIINTLESGNMKPSSELEKIIEGKKFIPATLSISFLVASLFFVSSSLTGFSVLNINPLGSKWIGSCLFVCGLIFAFIYLKNKK